MTLRHAYSLHERAAWATIAANDSERGGLLSFFEALARDPGRRGTEQALDESGRANEVACTDHYRVVYRPDHAVRKSASGTCAPIDRPTGRAPELVTYYVTNQLGLNFLGRAEGCERGGDKCASLGGFHGCGHEGEGAEAGGELRAGGW